MDILEEKNIRQRFVFLNSLRIAVLFILVFVFVVIFLTAERNFSFVPIFVTLGIAIVIGIAGFKFFFGLRSRPVFFIQSIADISVISILVYYTGGVTSPLYFLYIFPIIITAMFLTRKDTFYVATLSYIVFGTLSDLIYLEIIPYYPLIPSVMITLNLFIYNLVMSFFAFSSFAFLSSYYFYRLRKTGAELKNARENLKDLILLNNTVLERMENGFIITDSTGSIITYNEKSKVFLDIKGDSNIFELLVLNVDNKKNTTGSSPADGSNEQPFTSPANQNSQQSQQSQHSQHSQQTQQTQPPDSQSTQTQRYFELETCDLILGISYTAIENIYSFEKVYVFIVTDLTEKRQIEKRLREKEHFALIGEMSASIAHEIRNPLASISGSIQFLKKELKLETEYQHLMDIIIKESMRLSHSIEIFLDYAKITPLQLTAFDLTQVVDDVAELLAVNQQNVAIIKKYNAGMIVTADNRKIKQVVWNLLNNCLKALESGGTIEVNIYRKNNNIYFAVKDNGVGIEAADLPRIFTPFYSRFSSGIGLGMATVKRIIDEHQFTINVKSIKNIGTEVIICFKNTPKY